MQFWYAFKVLSAARSSGYGTPNPIAVSEILTFADELMLNREEALFYVQGLDNTFLEEIGKKQEIARKTAANKARR